MTKERFDEIRKREYAEDRVVYFANGKEVMPLHVVNDDEWLIAYLNLNSIYETKERAEWALKTYAIHTERFEPPMWEDIENYYDFRFVVNNKCLRLYIRKDVDCIVLFTEDDDRIFEASATKENYEKACEIVRNLFTGESNGKEVK